MEIFKIVKSAVNETIVINLVKKDYDEKIQKQINKKMPLATVKGFKKGKAPRNLVIDQYGLEIKIEEISKIVDQELAKYITSENFDLLGTPLYIDNDDFNWNDDTLVFQYEIGLAPKFDLNLGGLEVNSYKIVADQAMIDNQVERLQKQYGTLATSESIAVDSEIEAHFENQDANIDATSPFELTVFKEKATRDSFIGKKVGDTITVNTKNLFEDDHKLMDVFNVPHDQVHTIAVDVVVTIKSINSVAKAELNQVLFDQIYGAGVVTSLDDMKAKIAQESEAYFKTQSQQKLLDDVVLQVIDKNKFELPQNFLTRWLQTAGKTDLTIQESTAEYSRTENGLRYQMIESKAIAMLEDRLTFEDLKSHTASKIKDQMRQYGYNATAEEVESIVAKTLANQDEIRKISNEVVKTKALELIKSKATITEKEVTFDQYIKEFYGE